MSARRNPEAGLEPRPTVREVMRSEAFAKAKLVAGAEGLDHAIEWVRLMETPEVQPRAGDLMFTTGFPIKDDREAQIRLEDIGEILPAVGQLVERGEGRERLAIRRHQCGRAFAHDAMKVLYGTHASSVLALSSGRARRR